MAFGTIFFALVYSLNISYHKIKLETKNIRK